MKNILILASLLISGMAFAKNSSDELFSGAERKQIVRMIDDLCGDTWCEGDYDFNFTKFSCSKKSSSCVLNFQFIKINDDESKVFSSVQSCKFNNIQNLNQIKESEYGLNDSFYEELSDCINEKEQAIKF